ncbi:MAG: GNAT family N-acetyltransferase [Bacillota bacterium]
MNTDCQEPVINVIDCDRGVISIEGPVAADYLLSLNFDDGLCNFRAPGKQKQCLCELACSPDGFLYIAKHRDTVVGYVTFHSPDPYTRWHKHPLALELGAIEVSPRWRNYKVGGLLLQSAFNNPLMKERIVLTMEYCWHWDLENNKMSLWQYQLMLTRLFGSVGLRKVDTDDPEILEHPANVLMVRIGENVPSEYVELFEKMRYMGTPPWNPRV